MVQIQVQPPAPARNGMAAGEFQATSLYVGDLDVNVTDSQLNDLFSQVGQVVSVKVCRDLSTGRSLGYGYVSYSNPDDDCLFYVASGRAIDVLNFIPLNNKDIRVTFYNRDSSVRKSGAANIIIKNLDKAINAKSLQESFSSFGNILSCKIATDTNGQSNGYGFVQFDTEEAAQTAIDMLNGMLINDKQLFVGHFLRKQDSDSASTETNFNNVFVKNLAESTTDDDLKATFGEYGNITSSVVMRDSDGNSRCFGFVNFENADDAAKAVESLHGKKVDEKKWYVGKALKKPEREQELKNRFELTTRESVDKFKGLNLYVKNLDDSFDDEKLKELFAEFGTITSCKVMCNPSGIRSGTGFVAFSTPEEASQALYEMNGRMVINKPLYVAIAQRKEERRAILQAQFSQMRPAAMPVSIAPCKPLYLPGDPGIGQQLFNGQPPTMMPPQKQLVPGMQPEVWPMPNFFVPLVQQFQHPGVMYRAGGVQLIPQHMPVMQQQTMLRGRKDWCPLLMGDGRLPRDSVAIPRPTLITALVSALTNATPKNQRTLLGDYLYPLVEQLVHDHAPKVTGMLLEMDQTEVLHLLESPDALKSKVSEAMDVLRNVQQQSKTPTAPLEALDALSNVQQQSNSPAAPLEAVDVLRNVQQQSNTTADQLASLSLKLRSWIRYIF